jgi:hypothetical protein
METNIISEPKYQDIKDIAKEYDGYCVCIVRGKGKPDRLSGGEVVGYGDSVPELGTALSDILDREDSGLVVFESYQDFSDISLIEVIPLEY